MTLPYYTQPIHEMWNEGMEEMTSSAIYRGLQGVKGETLRDWSLESTDSFATPLPIANKGCRKFIEKDAS